MFDIGFSELIIIFVIALIVLGPERLPKAARYVGSIFGKMRNTWQGIQMEIERELHIDELKKQAQEIKESAQNEFDAAQNTLDDVENNMHQLSQEAQQELNKLADVIEAKQTPNQPAQTKLANLKDHPSE